MPIPILAIIAAAQLVQGAIKSKNAKRDAQKLLSQKQAYRTPQEVTDILNATQANAQQGLDATTLNFLTNQTDQAFAGSIGSAERLGADPNVLSDIFNQKVNSIMQIGAQNHSINMQNFSTYLNALGSLGANKAAEQKSQQDLLKDQLQQVAIEKQVASQQMSEGLNTAVSAYSTYQMGKLYNPDGTLKTQNTNNNFNENRYLALVQQQNAQNTRGYNP